MTVLFMSIGRTLRYAALVLCLFLVANVFYCPVANAGMATVEAVVVADASVTLKTDSKDLDYDYYTLGAPPRLVVDVMDALPQFEERSFKVPGGFSTVRVGMYADKTRFVFDAEKEQLPIVRVGLKGNDIVIDWSQKKTAAVVKSPRAEKPASVQSIDFDTQNGVSLFTATFDSRVKLISPVIKDDTVTFGAKNTAIPRSLRRVVDASVFPSAVLQITPYSTIVAGERNVMFAAKMKGPVEYSVTTDGNSIIFRSVDGPFAQAAPAASASVYVPVESFDQVQQAEVDSVKLVLDRLADESMSQDGGLTDEAPKVYTGSPVTLVLDDADIRKVMQLIAEISDLNMILSDDVKGEISLRLHDVPWDQALDLILEIKELGTIRQGNVVRILPLKTIQAMETAKLKSKKEIMVLEETKTEIFEISYKDTSTIKNVIEDILSPQGEVTTIDGSKKIMVNDISAKLDEVRELLKVLDEPVKQVMIEARIVEMRKTDGLDLGINWGVNYTNDAVPDINSSSSVTNADGSSSDTSVSRDNGIQTTSSSATDAAGNEVSSSGTDGIPLGISTVNDAAVGLGGAFLLPSTLGTSGLGGLINFGRLGVDSTVVNLRISALEASGTAKVVSSPKVLTLDGESAKIEQGTSIPYQSVGDDGTKTEFEDATLSLEVTPEVNPDNTVILEIKASNSSIGSTVATGIGSAPAIDRKEAETKLMLRDGETTVIGGIYVDSTLTSNTGTPFLKDIPYLGKLFESNSSSSDRSELLIFITPHIVE